LRAPDRRVDLLPGGSATIEQAGGTEFRRDSEVVRATLYGISGLGLGPTFIWLDESGELFGYTDRTWASSAVAGNQACRVAGGGTQRTAAPLRKNRLGASRELTGLTVIRGARIFDSIAGRLTPPSTVFVWDGKISAVYPGPVAVPEGALLIDGEGETLMPSLWDMHNHVQLVYLPRVPRLRDYQCAGHGQQF
jgi:hypothetical protein